MNQLYLNVNQETKLKSKNIHYAVYSMPIGATSIYGHQLVNINNSGDLRTVLMLTNVFFQIKFITMLMASKTLQLQRRKVVFVICIFSFLLVICNCTRFQSWASFAILTPITITWSIYD